MSTDKRGQGDDGHLTKVEAEVKVNTRLYKYFTPEVARELCALPAEVRLRKEDKEKPLAQQRWVLTVVIAEDNLGASVAAADHYAERIRDGEPRYWGGLLTVSFIPAPRDWIAARLRALENEWALHHSTPAEIAAEIIVPPPTPQQLAVQGLNDIAAERTSSAIPEVVEAVRTDRDEERTIVLREPGREKDGGRQLLFAVFNYAIAYRASDIHVEWTFDDTFLPRIQIRVRIDGTMRMLIADAGPRGRQMLGILAVMAGANAGLNEMGCHIKPQDGAIPVKAMDGRRFDCRIVFTPARVASQTFNAVIRLQDMAKMLRIGDLNLSAVTRERVDYALAADEGMIVLNGPTGSGKSVSLLALLMELHNDDTKIVTAENPIEMKVAGLHQQQVDARDPENSFAALLRAALRSDPDCILVAEIRDKETAEVAIQAVDTGHLVFTTIHAKGALGVPARLHSLLGDWHAVGNALSLVIAQRLFKRPAKDRWRMTGLDRRTVERQVGFSLAEVDEKVLANFQAPQLLQQFDPKDMENYAGRTGIHEAVWFDADLREAIIAGTPARQLTALARQKGMVTLVEDALIKASRGETTLDQIRGLRPI